MDLALIIGIVIAFALLVGAIIFAGASVNTYISIDSALLVGGGVIGSALAGITFKEAKKVVKATIETFKPKKVQWIETIELFTSLSTISRREGVLALQSKVDEQDNDIIRTGLQLIIDGADSEILFSVVGTKVSIQKAEDKLGESIMSRMSNLGPAFGLLGTVTGLVQVLANLSEPEKLGIGIAQAFMTTLYGIIFGSIIFGPIATKIERNNQERFKYYEMIMTGLQSIHEGDNPFIIEEKLNAFCPEALEEAAKQTKEPKQEEALEDDVEAEELQPEAS
jgi:chemotaxis protein MotA